MNEDEPVSGETGSSSFALGSLAKRDPAASLRSLRELRYAAAWRGNAKHFHAQPRDPSGSRRGTRPFPPRIPRICPARLSTTDPLETSPTLLVPARLTPRNNQRFSDRPSTCVLTGAGAFDSRERMERLPRLSRGMANDSLTVAAGGLYNAAAAVAEKGNGTADAAAGKRIVRSFRPRGRPAYQLTCLAFYEPRTNGENSPVCGSLSSATLLSLRT